jgi:5-methyltetrahydropteroyltriglutamate--homocysteine methyltransferase
MKRSTERILTTHVGSLARPHPLLELMKARAAGESYDQAAFATLATQAVEDVVRKQTECGIDIVSDGEQSKSGFFAYVAERLTGLDVDAVGVPDRAVWQGELDRFPEYYREYLGGKAESMIRYPPLICTGPIAYKGHAALRADLDNLHAAVQKTGATEAFVPSIAPRGLGRNAYYPSGEAFMAAIAEAMREEYLAIVEAGFLLQIDDPWLTALYQGDPFGIGPERHVELLNHALRGIPPEQIRYHTCYGINEGPRIHDVPMLDLVPLLLKINAAAYSFEAANPRHLHEWRIWKDVKLPDDKVLIPGMICHAYNIVEHPELIADFLVMYAESVGRERVIAGADCGFSSSATFSPEVDAKVVWAKFESLSEGARLASQRLWK